MQNFRARGCNFKMQQQYWGGSLRKLPHDLTGMPSREMKAEETQLFNCKQCWDSRANASITQGRARKASPRDEHANDAHTLCAGTSVALKTEVLKKEELLGHEMARQVQELSTHPW